MYKAYVLRPQYAPHPNAEKLKLAFVMSESVVTGADMDDEWVLYFPENGRLSHNYCIANQLYPVMDEGVKVGGGYIDPMTRRVRAQNFRGERSNGLVMPLSSLRYLASREKVDQLVQEAIKAEAAGEYFGLSEINGFTFVEKYIREGQKGTEAVSTPSTVKDDTFNGTFPRLQDTPNLYHVQPGWLPEGDGIITEKLHGTSGRVGRINKGYKGLKGLVERLIDKILNRPSTVVVVGTRRTLAQVGKGGFFGDDDGAWRVRMVEQLGKNLLPGEVVYYEIVGYYGGGKSIMPSHDPGRVTGDKDFAKERKRYESPTVYHYGVNRGESKIFVYKIRYRDRDLTWKQQVDRVQQWQELGIDVNNVPLIEVAKGTRPQIYQRCKSLASGPTTLIPGESGKTHPREGVVLRFDTPLGAKVFKAKSFPFLVMEGIANEETGNAEDVS